MAQNEKLTSKDQSYAISQQFAGTASEATGPLQIRAAQFFGPAHQLNWVEREIWLY